uniref:KIB1-4 beta-propeller domain-containing protein n=1 Tax=Oryza rufipogon TaxID=4529 RepID=A0A0E0N0J2_ORYRU
MNLRLHPKPEPPWLMLPAAGDSPQHLAVADFYSFSDGRRRSITLPSPAIQSRMWIGSAKGWLVTTDDKCGLHLLNPISGTQHSLPSITTTGYFDALPRTDGDEARVVLARGRDAKWMPLQTRHMYEDVIVYRGQFYMVTLGLSQCELWGP